MTIQVLLLLTLAATDILIGVQSLGVFWPVFAVAAFRLYRTVRPQFPLELFKILKSLSVVLVAMAISSLTSGAAKASSLAYAAMFAFYGFWLLASLGAFQVAHTVKAMKIVMVAYFGSSLAATLTVAMGISGLESFLFTRIWTNVSTGESRPIGFSSEPSYAACIVVLAWMTLVRLGHIRPWGRNGFGFWTSITLIALQLLGSIYGYLLGIVVALTAISLLPRRMRTPWLAGGTVLGPLAVAYIAFGGDDARTTRILRAVATGDLETWLLEDTSSFFRLGPLFSYITSANFGEIGTWLGHGATSAGYFFTEMFRMHISADKDSVELGLMPAFIYDYGLITGALLLGFLYRTTRGYLRPAMVAIFTLLIFNANFSTQIMWFAVTCGLLSRQPVNTAPSPR